MNKAANSMSQIEDDWFGCVVGLTILVAIIIIM